MTSQAPRLARPPIEFSNLWRVRWRRWAAGRPPRQKPPMGPQRLFFRIVQRDTLSFSTVEAVDLFGKLGVKFLSIDAGHTIQHACNDLHLAQEILVPGGIVALDDYMSPHWPGVTEGFYRFMSAENRRLKPFMYFQNKLFLTTISEYAACLQQFRAAIEASCGDEVSSGRWAEVEIAGSNCLSFQ